eukprot:606801-Pelagomonas_calceolata.AAC.8
MVSLEGMHVNKCLESLHALPVHPREACVCMQVHRPIGRVKNGVEVYHRWTYCAHKPSPPQIRRHRAHGWSRSQESPGALSLWQGGRRTTMTTA